MDANLTTVRLVRTAPGGQATACQACQELDTLVRMENIRFLPMRVSCTYSNPCRRNKICVALWFLYASSWFETSHGQRRSPHTTPSTSSKAVLESIGVISISPDSDFAVAFALRVGFISNM